MGVRTLLALLLFSACSAEFGEVDRERARRIAGLEEDAGDRCDGGGRDAGGVWLCDGEHTPEEAQAHCREVICRQHDAGVIDASCGGLDAYDCNR